MQPHSLRMRQHIRVAGHTPLAFSQKREEARKREPDIQYCGSYACGNKNAVNNIFQLNTQDVFEIASVTGCCDVCI